MNFTPQQRIDLLNNNGWSKNDVRQLIRDCEELETKISNLVEAPVSPILGGFTEKQLNIIGNAVEKWLIEDTMIVVNELTKMPDGKNLIDRLKEASQNSG